MGSFLGKAMDENLKKNQEFMLQAQQMTLERQIQMQNLMRERQMAMQISTARERFYWFGSFYVLATLGMFRGYYASRKPAVIAPFVPLSFFIAYQYDFAFYTKLERIRNDADHILEAEAGLLNMPGGIPTLQQIDERRK